MKIGIKAMQALWVITFLLASTAFGHAEILRKVPQRAPAIPKSPAAKRAAQRERWIDASHPKAPSAEAKEVELGNGQADSFFSVPSKARIARNFNLRNEAAAASGTLVKSFDGPPYIPVSPQAVDALVYASAIADFDHANGPDIADLESDGTLNIFLNDGKGGFGKTYSNSEAKDPAAGIAFLREADVNADGYADIVGMDVYQSKLIVFLNDGSGHFRAGPSVSVLPQNGATLGWGGSFAVGDVNNDGHADLVVVSTYINEDTFASALAQQTFLGNGDGTFQKPIEVDSTFDGYFYVEYGAGIELADLNGDGQQDMVVELAQAYTDYTVTIATAMGSNGRFATLAPYGATIGSAEATNSNLELFDVNGDGHVDVLFLPGDDNLYVTYGNSDGSMNSPIPLLPNLGGARNYHYTDLNGDHLPDALIYGYGSADLYAGSAGGTFAPVPLGHYTAPLSVGDEEPAAADLNGDGLADFVWTDPNDGAILIYESRPDGKYAASNALTPANTSTEGPNNQENVGNIRTITTGDFNGDGFTDILAWDFNQVPTGGLADARVAFSNGKGSFTFAPGLTSKQQQDASVDRMIPVTADINGDGRSDLIMQAHGGGLSYALMNADGTVQTPVSVFLGSDFNEVCLQLESVVVKDINGDGILDIVSAYEGYVGCGEESGTPSGYMVSLGQAGGKFATTFTPYGYSIRIPRLADMNGDGILDLILDDMDSHDKHYEVDVLPGKGDGTFDTTKASIAITGTVIDDVLTTDYNGDGKQDLVLFSSGKKDPRGLTIAGTGAVILVPGNNDFTFGDQATLVSGISTRHGAIADVNGDGLPDILFAQIYLGEAPSATFGVTTYPNLGGGKFGPPNSTAAPAVQLFPADFNGDGATDFALQAGAIGEASVVMFNARASTLSVSASPTSTVVGNSVTLTAILANTIYSSTELSGEVTFYANGTSLGKTQVVNNSAQLSVSDLPVGADVITAAYLGDTDHNPSKSAATTITITDIDPTFALTGGSAQVTVATGKTGTLPLSLESNSAFSGVISFACTGLPQGSTCTFSPATLTLDRSAKGSVNLQINAGPVQTSQNESTPHPWANALGTASLALVFLGGLRKRRSKLFLLPLIVLALSGVAGLTGCGNDHSNKPSTSLSVVGVTATATIHGKAVTQTLPVTLVITK